MCTVIIRVHVYSVYIVFTYSVSPFLAGVAEKETHWMREGSGSRGLAGGLLDHFSLSHTLYTNTTLCKHL